MTSSRARTGRPSGGLGAPPKRSSTPRRSAARDQEITSCPRPPWEATRTPVPSMPPSHFSSAVRSGSPIVAASTGAVPRIRFASWEGFQRLARESSRFSCSCGSGRLSKSRAWWRVSRPVWRPSASWGTLAAARKREMSERDNGRHCAIVGVATPSRFSWSTSVTKEAGCGPVRDAAR